MGECPKRRQERSVSQFSLETSFASLQVQHCHHLFLFVKAQQQELDSGLPSLSQNTVNQSLKMTQQTLTMGMCMCETDEHLETTSHLHISCSFTCKYFESLRCCFASHCASVQTNCSACKRHSIDITAAWFCSKRVRGPPEEEIQKKRAEGRKVCCLTAPASASLVSPNCCPAMHMSTHNSGLL